MERFTYNKGVIIEDFKLWVVIQGRFLCAGSYCSISLVHNEPLLSKTIFCCFTECIQQISGFSVIQLGDRSIFSISPFFEH